MKISVGSLVVFVFIISLVGCNESMLDVTLEPFRYKRLQSYSVNNDSINYSFEYSDSLEVSRVTFLTQYDSIVFNFEYVVSENHSFIERSSPYWAYKYEEEENLKIQRISPESGSYDIAVYEFGDGLLRTIFEKHGPLDPISKTEVVHDGNNVTQFVAQPYDEFFSYYEEKSPFRNLPTQYATWVAYWEERDYYFNQMNENLLKSDALFDYSYIFDEDGYPIQCKFSRWDVTFTVEYTWEKIK